MLNDIEALLSADVREQMLADIAANQGAEVLWWGKLEREAEGAERPDEQAEKLVVPVNFVEAAACGNDDSVLAHFPYMERGDVVLHNHPSGPVQPSDADMQVANELALQGIGFYIVDNFLRKICVVAKPVQEQGEQALDADKLAGFLGSEGPLRDITAEYEERPAQQELLRLVAEGFNSDKIIVAEGGTGIGKSFAYLLPTVFWAVKNKQRVVVSTATINLQQQLIEKDIPIIQRISGLEQLQAVLVKGRGNYLCLRRMKQAQEEQSATLDLEETYGNFREELANIAQWSTATSDGSLSNLSFRPQSGVWSQVCGESDNCLGLRCEFHENCFIIQARRRAAAAHILVVNHHLLFADLAVRSEGVGHEKTAVLPPYRHVIVDEAHNVERSVQSFFSRTLTKFSAQRSLRRIYFKRGARERGLWAHLRRYAELESEDLPDIASCCQQLSDALASLDAAAGDVLNQSQKQYQNQAQSNLRIPDYWTRLPMKGLLEERLWPQLEQVNKALQNLLRALKNIYELLENVVEGDEQKSLIEWRQISRRIEDLRSIVLQWQALGLESDEEEVEQVFWLERSRRSETSSFQRLVCTQIQVGELLQKVLYEPMRSVCLVSATLTVKKRFDYWLDRVGLSDWQKDSEDIDIQEEMQAEMHEEIQAEMQAEIQAQIQAEMREGFEHEGAQQKKSSNGKTPLAIENDKLSAGVFHSPFCYAEQVVLLLASDAPNPSQAADYEAYVGRFAREAVQKMGGRSLLLFTSYAALHRCYDVLNDPASYLRQGEDDNARLLQRFKEDQALSLLATDSFWEGVDAPGSTLMQVLLCRLPFRSPDDPIVAAHTEFMERKGQNAFFDYSLPEAVLRFRQGFGRLMRRSSDKGLIVVLDPRIVSKRYGRDFLNSLPKTKLVKGNFAMLQKYIQDYARTEL